MTGIPVRILFAIAVHHLKRRADRGSHRLVALDVLDGVVVEDAVDYGLRVQELSVDHQVEQAEASEGEELILSDAVLFLLLFLSSFAHAGVQLFAGHVLVLLGLRGLWVGCQGGLDGALAVEEVADLLEGVLGILYLDLTFALRKRQEQNLGVFVDVCR